VFFSQSVPALAVHTMIWPPFQPRALIRVAPHAAQVECNYPRFLTQQTYAYNLVDHLTWMVIHRKTPRSIALDDLVTGVPQEI
jgi:hypothetical protein